MYSPVNRLINIVLEFVEKCTKYPILGSQAVSSTNLTNDDTLSIRSMSVDETPDFDKAMDYTQLSRTKNSMVGLRNEITELRNDINDLKNDIVESKNELDDSSFDKVKTPVLTPGSRNRINPFLRDCEDIVKNEADKGPLVDPLGAIPVENSILSNQNKSVEITQVNGEIHDTSIGKKLVTYFYITKKIFYSISLCIIALFYATLWC